MWLDLFITLLCFAIAAWAIREALVEEALADQIIDRAIAEHGTAPRLAEIPLAHILNDYDLTDRTARCTDITSEAL